MLWYVDIDTAALWAVPVLAYFQTADCSGPAWINSATPRIPVQYDEDLFVRPDELQKAEECGILAIDLFGSCAAQPDVCMDLLPLDEFLPVTRPTTSWTAPLHPEPIP